MLRAPQDRGRVIAVALATTDDGLLHALDRMRGQKLQHADEMAGAGAWAMLVLQGATQFAEHRRQLPVAVDVGVIQCCRLARQRHQIVQGIEHLLVVRVRAPMVSNHLAGGHDVHVGHIRLDGHVLKGVHARHAVAVAIEVHRLVLVHAGGPLQTRIESPCRQRQSLRLLAPETLADGLFLARLSALAIAQTAGVQVRVQFVQVVYLRHRRRPGLLQKLHAPLGAGLLLRAAHQAEERLEVVMTRQGGIAPVELTRAAFEQMRHHGLGIVPPHLTRHTAKEREGLDQAVQDRLGSFRGQGQHERAVRVSPGRDQHRHLPAPVREIDVDVTEVGFQALARIVIERDERLPALATLSTDIVPYPLIAALVAVLGLQPPPQLLHRVPLLTRRLLVAGQDRIQDRLERIQDGRRRLEPAVTLRLWRGQDLANLASRMMEPTSQLANAQPVHEMRSSHLGILVQRNHPPPPCSWTWCTSIQEVCGWARFRRGFALARIIHCLVQQSQACGSLWRGKQL